MTALQPIGAMSSNRVILGQLLSSRAGLCFPGQHQPATQTPVRSRGNQRTAYRDLLYSLNPGGHPNLPKNDIDITLLPY
jgi:hypothetical protein